MSEAVMDRIRALDDQIDRLREDTAPEEIGHVESLASDLEHARERVQILHEQDDDMTDLALRESARALDEIGDRIQWVRTHVTGGSSR